MSSSPVQAFNGSPPLSSSLRARPFQCIFVFSYPRTMSNLFLRFFAQHPQVGVIDYPFDAAYMAGPERQSRRSNPQIDALIKARKAADHCVTYQMAYDTMQTQRRKIEAKGKIPLIKQPVLDITDPSILPPNLPPAKNRIPSITDPDCATSSPNPSLPQNPTVLPATFMDSLLPIILIRHPALMIPSFYRVASRIHGARIDDAEFPINATLGWSRLVLDYYVARRRSAGRPIVIDASSLTGPDTETLMAEVCRIAGLEAQFLQFEWSRPLEEQAGGISEGTKVFREAFLGSTGVLKRGKGTGEVVLPEEVRAWRGEFGDDVAEGILRLVQAAMGDWEYLRGFALRVGGL